MSMLQQSIATATNIDTLIAGQEDLLVPPESLQDKVFFIFTNLSIANMDVKVSSNIALIHTKVIMIHLYRQHFGSSLKYLT